MTMMKLSKNTSISVFELIGAYPVSYESAELLYQELLKGEKKSEIITIDFNKVKIVASPFFNGSICLLLKKYSIDELLSIIKIINLNKENKDILNIAIENAIEFYKKR